MILILTNKEDVHPTPVIEYLHGRGCPVFRLNTEALLTDYDFSWWANADGTDFHIRNVRTGLELWGHDVTAVWERRPVLPKDLPVENREEINRHNREEAAGFLSFLLYYVDDRFCIGHHLHERQAGSKMWQLKVAQEVGMAVPDTCFSNRKADILAFASRYDYVILKSIENDNVWLDDEQEYVFYGQRVASPLLAEQPEEAFTQTVSFVQEYVDKAFELRVTVVGREIFACKLDSQCLKEDEGKVDWRQGYEHGLRHEAFELSLEVAGFCRAYLERMHLNFGCFDFIVTPSGKYVFLECNSNGQWLWIELQTGQKISVAIAECLMRGSAFKPLQHVEDGKAIVHVENAGTLPLLIGNNLKYQITHLTLTGELNGTDLLFLREMLEWKKDAKPILRTLNLADARFVEGGYTDFYKNCYVAGEAIPEHAFEGIDSLEEVKLPATAVSIGTAFCACFGLTSIEFPPCMEKIGDMAFNSCGNLASIQIPKHVKSIGYRSFAGSGLVSIELPEGVASIGNFIFYNCQKLQFAKIPGSVIHISDVAFGNCTGLLAVELAEGINSIGNWAFMQCEKLASIKIPRTVKSLGHHAFTMCESLISIELSESVEYLDFHVWEGCHNLKEIHLKSLFPLPALSASDISDYLDLGKISLYIPQGTLALYHQSPKWESFWGRFKEIVEEKDDNLYKGMIMERTKKELYDEWVDRVCRFIEEAGPEINCVSCAFQSKPVLDKEPEVVFLGYNAHEPYGYMGPNRERFYEGNPSFYADRDNPAWKVWNKPYAAFKYAEYLEPMTDGNFVFMNAVYFGSDTIKSLQAKPESGDIIAKCLNFTAEVIQSIFRPRCVVCFSVTDCFLPLAQHFKFTEVETLNPPIINGEPARQRVMKGFWGTIPTYGIPHPSGRVNNDDWGAIAMYLKKEMQSLNR